MTKYKISFEIETWEFADEMGLELALERLFPNWKKLEVKEIEDD